jgi:hypothetical protein
MSDCPYRPWRPPSSHGRHGASLQAPPHTTISQHSGLLLYMYVPVPRVGHHGGRCRPIWSRLVNRRSCVVVSVFLLGKLASKHAPTNHGGRLSSHCRGSLHTKSVASLCPPIWYIMAVCCMVAVEVQKAEWEKEERFSARCNFSHRLIMEVNVVLRPP